MKPTRRLLAGAGLWTALGVLPSVWPTLAPWWFGLGGALALLTLLDALWLALTPRPTATRRVEHILPVGTAQPVHLQIENRAKGQIALRVHDAHPSEAQCDGLPVELRLAPRRGARLEYRLRCPTRGTLAFGSVHVAMRRRLGLLERRVDAAAAQTVRVYPNFAAVAGLAVLAAQDRTSAVGIRQMRRRGAGLEFHELRDYRDGDPLRQIDWKATSRRRKVIARDYQEDRDQQVVFLLDCGRRMRSHDGELSHFDHSLNALLLLAWVALRQGDAVAVGTFAGETRWLAPRKGPAAFRSLIRHLFDLQSTLAPADYTEAAATLLARMPRRALVVCITNLRDEDSSEVLAAVQALRRRHLVLLADLREGVVDELVATAATDLANATTLAAAHGFLAQRRQLHASLRGRGAMLLDCRPRELPVAITNRYLELKRAGAM
jgi:uncharacterized protein (DUF58 family)